MRVKVFVVEIADSPIWGIPGMHANMPQVTGADELRDSLQVQITDRTGFPVGVQKQVPANGDRILKATAPEKDGQVIRTVAMFSAVKVVEGQGAVSGDLGRCP